MCLRVNAYVIAFRLLGRSAERGCRSDLGIYFKEMLPTINRRVKPRT